jgi:hypothetical protein
MTEAPGRQLGPSPPGRITVPFGLIHGFGIAGALREIALPQAEVPIALVSFIVRLAAR